MQRQPGRASAKATNRHLGNQHRHAQHAQGHDITEKEGATTMLTDKIRQALKITQAHRDEGQRQDERTSRAPRLRDVVIQH